MRRRAFVGGAAAITLAGVSGSLLAVVAAGTHEPLSPAAHGGGQGTYSVVAPPDGDTGGGAVPAATQAADAAGMSTPDGGGPAVGSGQSTSDGTAGGSGAAGGSPAPGTGGTQDGGAGCGEQHWPAVVQGAPGALHGGARAGDYLWHSGDGFHLGITHRGDRSDVFTGTIRADAPMVLRPVRLEGRDAVAISADRRTITFRFYDYGRVDGLSFGTACATGVTLDNLRVDTVPLPAGRVYLGAGRGHPAALPVVLTR